jgi:hypothetical protein
MPASVNELPMPIPPGRDARVEKVRAAKISGDASALALWSKPWRTAGTGNQTYSTGRAAAVVEGKDFRICLMQDDQQVGTHTVEGNTFQGRFGVVVTRDGTVSEIYLGSGHGASLHVGETRCRRLAAKFSPESFRGFNSVAGWSVFRRAGEKAIPPGGTEEANWHLETSAASGKVIVATGILPAGQNQEVSLKKNDSPRGVTVAQPQGWQPHLLHRASPESFRGWNIWTFLSHSSLWFSHLCFTNLSS